MNDRSVLKNNQSVDEIKHNTIELPPAGKSISNYAKQTHLQNLEDQYRLDLYKKDSSLKIN